MRQMTSLKDATTDNTTKQRAIMVQEDEVLALAIKIKEQRRLNKEYQVAFDLLNTLKSDIATCVTPPPSGNKELRHRISIKFWTVRDDCHQEDWSVDLPTQCGDDLIDFLIEYTDDRTPD